MADRVYNVIKRDLLKGDLDFDTATVKMLLYDTSHSSDVDDDTLNDFTTLDEINESGYSRQTLATVAVTLDDANDRAYVDADSPAFGTVVAGGTIAGGIVYKDGGGGATTDVPISDLDLPNTATNGQAVTVNFAATGFLMLS